jgi:hypothetical protein
MVVGISLDEKTDIVFRVGQTPGFRTIARALQIYQISYESRKS